MSAGADMWSSSFGIASGNRGARLEMTGPSGGPVPVAAGTLVASVCDHVRLTCLSCEPGTGGRSAPRVGAAVRIETTNTSTQLPTMRGVES